MDTERIEGEEDAVANEVRVFHRPHPSIPKSTHPDFGFVGENYVGPSVCSVLDPHPPHTEGSLACPGVIPMAQMTMTSSIGGWLQPTLDVSRETSPPIVMNAPRGRFLPVERAITFFREHPSDNPDVEAFFRKAQEDGRPITIIDNEGDVIATVAAGSFTVAAEGDVVTISGKIEPIQVTPVPDGPERVETAAAHAEDETVRIDDERLPAELLDDIVAIATGTEQEPHMDSSPLAEQVMQAVADAGMTIATGADREPRYELTETGEDLGPVFPLDAGIYEGLERAIARRDEILAEKVEPTTLYPDRHLGRIPVTHEALHKLVGLPDGLRIVGMYYDEQMMQLMLTVEGEMLLRTPQGTQPRDLAGQWRYAGLDADGVTYGRLDWFPESPSYGEDMWGGHGV